MKINKCFGCGANIFFASTTNGKSIPIDELPCEDGNLVIQKLDGEAFATMAKLMPNARVRYKSHFATCPNAANFRKAVKARNSHL
jgi:hypothetical protein